MENNIGMFDLRNICHIEKDIHFINMRSEFDFLNDEYGINMLYVRSNPRTICRCYDKLTQDGDSKCKICGGTGKISIIECIKGIYQNIEENKYDNMMEPDLKISNTVVVYFNHKAVPKINDRLFITAYKDNIPVNIIKSLVIRAVQPIRCDNGRIDFYKCFARFAPEKIIEDQRRLNKVPYEFKKKIMKGARYSWPQK